MTAAKILIDSEGRLQTDERTLAKLKNKEFALQSDGRLVPLTTEPRYLSEIEDMEERLSAYRAFKKRVMRPGGGKLPTTRAELNDLVYD